MIERRALFSYFFFLFFIFVLYEIVVLLSPFSGALLGACVLAVIFQPLYDAMRHKFKRSSESLLALVATLLVSVIVVVPIVLLVWTVVVQSEVLAPLLKQWSVTLEQWRKGSAVETVPWLGDMRSWLTQLGVRPSQFRHQLMTLANHVLTILSAVSAAVAANLIPVLMHLVIMLFALFFFFRDGKRMYQWMEELIPLDPEYKKTLTDRIHDTITAVARGWLLTAFIQGVLATLGYLLVGVPGAVLIGLLTAVIGLLPIVGTFGVWLPISFLFLVKGAYVSGFFLMGWGALVVVGFVDAVLRPYLVGQRTDLPTFYLVFALLGGVQVFGAKGIVLGPLLVGIAPILVDIYREHYLRRSAAANAARSAAATKSP